MEINPELFKYNALVSTSLFVLVLIVLLYRVGEFSYSQLTFSKSIHLLNPIKKFLFKANFIVKALLDAGFIWYLAATLSLSFTSPLILLWIIVLTSFALFAYFTDDRSTVVHEVFVYSWIVLWLFAEFASSWYIHSISFFQYTLLLIVIQGILAFGSKIWSKTNAIIQIICIISIYVWLVLFMNVLSTV